MVMMSGKGKRQKAEIMNSSRVMMLKEEVVGYGKGSSRPNMEHLGPLSTSKETTGMTIKQ